MVRFIAKPLVAGAFALLLGSTALTTAAHATVHQGFAELNDDGSVTTLFYDDEDKHYFTVTISADGKTFTVADVLNDNSNPEGTSTGRGSHSEKPNVIDLITKGGATYHVRIVPADSAELMSKIASMQNGGGFDAHGNPSDEDNGTGPGFVPVHSTRVKKTDAEIRAEIAAANEIAGQLASLEQSMGDGSEGSGEGPNGFNKDGGPGGTGDDNGNYTEGQNKNIGKTETGLLGAKPEVVNPPHWGSDTATHGGGSHSAAGGGSMGGAHGGPGH